MSGSEARNAVAGDKRRGLFKTLVFSLIPLITLLLLIELGVRIFVRDDRFYTDAHGIIEPDPDLVWRLEKKGDGPLKTNELGFRDGPYKADANIKILLLGDSVSWGDGVRETGRLYHSLLEYALGKRFGESAVEIINASVPGYSTFQQAEYLRLHGLALKPRLIVLQFCLNDVYERFITVEEYGGASVFMGIETGGKGASLVNGAYLFLLRESAAFRQFIKWFQDRARRMQTYNVRKLTQENPGREIEEAWNGAIGEIEKIHRTAKENGIPMLIMAPPYKFQLSDPENLRHPQDNLIAWAEKAGVKVVDLLPAMAAVASEGGENLFIDQSHLSPLGHIVAAKTMEAPLAEMISGDIGRQ